MARSDAVFIINNPNDGRPGVKCLNPMDVLDALQKERLPTHLVEKANSIRFGHGPITPEGYFLLSNVDYKSISNLVQGSIWPIVNIEVSVRYFNGNTYITNRIFIGVLTDSIRVLGAEDDDSAVILIKTVSALDYNKNCIPGGANNTKRKNYNHLVSHNYSNSDVPHILYGTACHSGSGHTCDDSVGSLETISSMLKDFVENNFIQNTGWFGIRYFEDRSYREVLHNISTTGLTNIEFLNKICEIARFTYTFTEDNSIRYTYISISSDVKEWPDTSDAVYTTINNNNESDYLREVKVEIESMDWRHYDDRTTGIRNQDNPHFLYTVPVTDDADLNPNSLRRVVGITIPNLVRSTLLQNEDKIEEDVNSITQRFLALEAIDDKVAYWKYFKDIHGDVGFGLDEVIYSDHGDGIGTTAIAKSIDNQALNYRNPKVNIHTPNPLGMWLYTFTLTENKGLGGYAAADLKPVLPAGGTTTISGQVLDSLTMFDLPLGAKGLCIRVHDGLDYGQLGIPNYVTRIGKDLSIFYIIQAECA